LLGEYCQLYCVLLWQDCGLVIGMLLRLAFLFHSL
jgi:hypothetical protein